MSDASQGTRKGDAPCVLCAEADYAEATLSHASEVAYAEVMSWIVKTREEHPNHD